MHADAAFIVGHAHHDKAQPCQDYALAGGTADAAWAVVSDGCSTGRRTDLGARLWAHAAAQKLHTGASLVMDEFADSLVQAAPALALGVTFDDLLATLVVMHCDGKKLRIMAFGDGCVLLKHTDGRVHAIELTYENNGPRYLAYETRAGMVKCWEQEVAASGRQARHWFFDAAGQLESCEDEELPAEQGRGWDFTFDLAKQPLSMALISSDGATSLEKSTANEWFMPLTAVRNGTGQFLQRRLAAMVRGWQKSGQKGPSDDLAVAGIWLEEEGKHV
jgi:hypothetical protein